MYRKLWIGKHNFLPEKMIYQVSYKGQTYYQKTRVLRMLSPVKMEESFFSPDDLVNPYP